MQTEAKVVKPCIGCGKDFTSYAYKNRLYCSMACWRKDQRVTTTCATCGKEFTHKRSLDRRYCSTKCLPGRTPTPENYVTMPCPVCSKEFTYHKSRPVQTCSKECHLQFKFPDARITTNCPECGKEFTYLRSWPRKFCSRQCAGKNTVHHIKHWKPSAYQTTCEQCGKEFTTTPKRTNGRFCSRKCYGLWMQVHAPTGENSPTWRGGHPPYYGANWRQQRRAARRRDQYTCQRCGITENELERSLDVHHIRRFGDFTDYKEANKMSNLISLCPTCHTAVEWQGNR